MARLTTLPIYLAGTLLAAALAGCTEQGGSTPESSATSDSNASTHETPAPPDTALGGSWIAHYDRPRATSNLEAAGLRKWAEEFFRAEEWGPAGEPITAVYTFTPASGDDSAWTGIFQVAYFEVTDVWHVGWRGTVNVNGDEIEMFDRFTGTTDVYRWTVKGDALVLAKLRSDAQLAKGIPVEVYDAAYLTDPLQRTDCPMDLGTDCPA